MDHQAYLKSIQNCKKCCTLAIIGVICLRTWPYICRHHYMIKLIKITIKYIKWAYTSDKYNLIFGILLLQEWWIWHCYSHPNYLWLNKPGHFDYLTLEAYISKTKNDRNKQISDSENWHDVGYKKGSHFTNNIHVQKDAKKHYFITTLNCIVISVSIILVSVSILF